MENVNDSEIKKVELTWDEKCWMNNLAFECKDKLEFLDEFLKDENLKDFIERNFKNETSLLVNWINESSSMKKIVRGDGTLSYQLEDIDVEIEPDTDIDDIDWDSHAQNQMEDSYPFFELNDSEVIDYVYLNLSNTVVIEKQKKVS